MAQAFAGKNIKKRVNGKPGKKHCPYVFYILLPVFPEKPERQSQKDNIGENADKKYYCFHLTGKKRRALALGFLPH